MLYEGLYFCTPIYPVKEVFCEDKMEKGCSYTAAFKLQAMQYVTEN